jgi:transcriptional regulator with XRE-family HTH domain
VATTIGAALRAARERTGLTQDQLSTRTGMSPQVLSRLERGDTDPRWSTVVRIANALGVSLDALKTTPGSEALKPVPIPRALRGELRTALKQLAEVTKRLNAVAQHMDSTTKRDKGRRP